MTTLPEKLSREIERVTVLREHYYRLSYDGDRQYFPVLCLINATLEAAHHAAGSRDPVEITGMVNTLRGFEDLFSESARHAEMR